MAGNGIKNGRLLDLAQREFQVFITGDRNLFFQQNVSKFSIAVVVSSRSIRLIHTRPLMPSARDSPFAQSWTDRQRRAVIPGHHDHSS